MKKVLLFSLVFFFEIFYFLFFKNLVILLADCCYCNLYGTVMGKQLGHVLIGMDFVLLDIGGHQTMLFMLHLRCVPYVCLI